MKIDVNIKSYKHKNKNEIFFSNLNFSILNKGFYFILGSSGIGKTTLLNIILGLHEGKLIGKVSYEDAGIVISPSTLRKEGSVGYQSQDFSLIPWINIEKNLLIPTKINRNLKVTDKEEIVRHLKSFNLDEKVLKEFPDSLSLGMKIRIGLIRAILYNPKIIILDELFTGIDSYTNDLISERLCLISKETTIISVSHSIERAVNIADEIFVLYKTVSQSREIIRYDKKDFINKRNLIINHLKS